LPWEGSYGESIAVGGQAREVKHLSTSRKRNQRDSLSSGERTGKSPNPVCVIARRRCRSGVVRQLGTCCGTSPRVWVLSRSPLERGAIDGESPVDEKEPAGEADLEYHGTR